MKKKKNLNSDIKNLNINSDYLNQNFLYKLKRTEANNLISLCTITGTLTLVMGGIIISIHPNNQIIDASQLLIGGAACGVNTILCYIEALVTLKYRKNLEKEEIERIENEIKYLKEKEFMREETKKIRMKQQVLKRLDIDKPKQKTFEYKEKETDNN